MARLLIFALFLLEGFAVAEMDRPRIGTQISAGAEIASADYEQRLDKETNPEKIEQIINAEQDKINRLDQENFVQATAERAQLLSFLRHKADQYAAEKNQLANDFNAAWAFVLAKQPVVLPKQSTDEREKQDSGKSEPTGQTSSDINRQKSVTTEPGFGK